MARGPNFWFTVGVAMFAAVGTFLFGFDTGIVTTTIAHQSWRDYMNDPNTAITGAVVSLYVRPCPSLRLGTACPTFLEQEHRGMTVADQSL